MIGRLMQSYLHFSQYNNRIRYRNTCTGHFFLRKMGDFWENNFSSKLSFVHCVGIL